MKFKAIIDDLVDTPITEIRACSYLNSVQDTTLIVIIIEYYRSKYGLANKAFSVNISNSCCDFTFKEK
jgi:phosphoribosylpyrophosphate synthetase